MRGNRRGAASPGLRRSPRIAIFMSAEPLSLSVCAAPGFGGAVRFSSASSASHVASFCFSSAVASRFSFLMVFLRSLASLVASATAFWWRLYASTSCGEATMVVCGAVFLNTPARE